MINDTATKIERTCAEAVQVLRREEAIRKESRRRETKELKAICKKYKTSYAYVKQILT